MSGIPISGGEKWRSNQESSSGQLPPNLKKNAEIKLPDSLFEQMSHEDVIGVSYILYCLPTLFPVTAQHGKYRSSTFEQKIVSCIVSVKIGKEERFTVLDEPATVVLRLRDTKGKVYLYTAIAQ